MKKSILLMLFISFAAIVFPQNFKQPAEFMKMMMASPFNYEIEALKNKVESNGSGNVIEGVLHVTKTNTESVIAHYSFSGSDSLLFPRAENCFRDGNVDSAIILYKELVRIAPNVSVYNTYLGQVLIQKGDSATSEQCFKNAIATNYYDYLAHWFLADLYYFRNKLSEAMNEVSLAIILNRNNPRIKKSFERIFKAAHHDDELWIMTPQVDLTRTGVNQVKVSVDTKWMGYAIAKAAWEYEPGYKEKMAKELKMQLAELSFYEEEECLFNEYAGLKNASSDVSKDKQLTALKTAAETKNFKTYVLFEALLPENPTAAYLQTTETLDAVRDYIVTIRNGAIK
jgi:tetratricopeptide (TPR) repeat protein